MTTTSGPTGEGLIHIDGSAPPLGPGATDPALSDARITAAVEGMAAELDHGRDWAELCLRMTLAHQHRVERRQRERPRRAS